MSLKQTTTLTPEQLSKLPRTKLVRCQCRRLLCKREPMHVEQDNSYVLTLKYKKMELMTFMMVIKCPSCGTRYRISGENGIEEKVVSYGYEHPNKS